MSRVTVAVDGRDIVHIEENAVGTRWAALLLLTSALDLEPIEVEKAREELGLTEEGDT